MFSAGTIAEIPPIHLGRIFNRTLTQEFPALVQVLFASCSVEAPVPDYLQVRFRQVLEETEHKILQWQLLDSMNLPTGTPDHLLFACAVIGVLEFYPFRIPGDNPLGSDRTSPHISSQIKYQK